LSGFAEALSEAPYDIVQFSGHGNTKGFCFEDDHRDCTAIAGAKETAQIIRSALPNLRLAIFVSCFSASCLDSLVNVAPFVITMQDAADDEAAVSFLGVFYDILFATGSIEKAFSMATCFITFSGRSGKLTPVLSRRAQGRSGTIVQACFGPGDSVFIDVREAEPDIATLGISRDEFLSLLTRKIRLHAMIFDQGQEDALLSIGPYFGVFSWKAGDDVIICHRIIRVNNDVSEDACEAWASLIVAYNDLRALRYRILPDPSSQSNAELLEQAIVRFRSALKTNFSEGRWSSILRQEAPDQFKVSRANSFANFGAAEASLKERDFQSAIAKLEITLSAIHDLLTALTSKFSMNTVR
jgi:hypothetical protein